MRILVAILALSLLATAVAASDPWNMVEILQGVWKVEYSTNVDSGLEMADGQLVLDTSVTSVASGLRGNLTIVASERQLSDHDQEDDLSGSEAIVTDMRIIATSPRTGTFRFVRHVPEDMSLLDELLDSDLQQQEHDDTQDSTLIEFDYTFDISALSGFAISQGEFTDAVSKQKGVYHFTFVSRDQFVLLLTRREDSGEFKVDRYIGKRVTNDAPQGFFARYGSTIMLAAAIFLPRLLGMGQHAAAPAAPAAPAATN